MALPLVLRLQPSYLMALSLSVLTYEKVIIIIPISGGCCEDSDTTIMSLPKFFTLLVAVDKLEGKPGYRAELIENVFEGSISLG